MGTAPGGTLAKAVTEAGGLGIIGFGYGNQERIDQEFGAVGNARVGCGFITWSLASQPHFWLEPWITILFFALSAQVYQCFIKQHEKHIEEEKVAKIPASLDLTPYRDQKDFALLRRLVRCADGRETGAHDRRCVQLLASPFARARSVSCGPRANRRSRAVCAHSRRDRR
jgi:nitronate monooxygenase